jgi:hypothetical protein
MWTCSTAASQTAHLNKMETYLAHRYLDNAGLLLATEIWTTLRLQLATNIGITQNLQLAAYIWTTRRLLLPTEI